MALRVEIAFGETWRTSVGSMLWTDVTDSVLHESVKIKRGRSSELDRMQTGTCSFNLINSDRKFDPEYAAGPFYGQLLPCTPVRVGWNYNDFFVGFIEDWPQNYDEGNTFATVSVQAKDLFSILAQTRLPGSVLEYEIRKDNPHGYWPLDESHGSTMVDRSGKGFDGQYALGTTDLTESVEVEQDVELEGKKFIGEQQRGFVEDVSSIIYTLPYVYEAVVAANAAPLSANSTFYRSGNGYEHDGTWLACWKNGLIFWNKSTSPSAGQLFTNLNIDMSVPHHIAVRETISHNTYLYIDGVLIPSQGQTVTAVALARRGITIGANNDGASEAGFSGFLAHVAQFSTDIGATRIQAHAQAARRPWWGDTTGQRLGRLLDVVGQPSADRDIALGNTILGAASLDRSYALEEILKVGDAEQGRLFVARDGKVRLRDRHEPQLLGPSAGFGDHTGYTPYTNLELAAPLNFIYNKVTAKAGDVEIEVQDDDSIEMYGERSTSVELPMVKNVNAHRGLAEYVLDRYKNPATRVNNLEIKALNTDPDWNTYFGDLEIGDRVSIRRTPQGVGAPILSQQIVEGIQWSLTPEQVSLSLDLSPTDTKVYASWDNGDWDEETWTY